MSRDKMLAIHLYDNQGLAYKSLVLPKTRRRILARMVEIGPGVRWQFVTVQCQHKRVRKGMGVVRVGMEDAREAIAQAIATYLRRLLTRRG